MLLPKAILARMLGFQVLFVMVSGYRRLIILKVTLFLIIF